MSDRLPLNPEVEELRAGSLEAALAGDYAAAVRLAGAGYEAVQDVYDGHDAETRRTLTGVHVALLSRGDQLGRAAAALDASDQADTAAGLGLAHLYMGQETAALGSYVTGEDAPWVTGQRTSVVRHRVRAELGLTLAAAGMLRIGRQVVDGTVRQPRERRQQSELGPAKDELTRYGSAEACATLGHIGVWAVGVNGDPFKNQLPWRALTLRARGQPRNPELRLARHVLDGLRDFAA